MTLLELKWAVDQAVEIAGDAANRAKVEVWCKKKMYRLRRVGQYQVMPNLILEVGEKVIDEEGTES